MSLKYVRIKEDSQHVLSLPPHHDVVVTSSSDAQCLFLAADHFKPPDRTSPRRAADRRRQRKSAAELPVTVLTAGKPARCGTYWHLLFGLCNRTVWNLPEGLYTVLVLKMF